MAKLLVNCQHRGVNMEQNMLQLFHQKKNQARYVKPTGFGKFGNKIPQFQLLVPPLQPTHTHQAKLTKQVSSHMPGYAMEREKYMLSQMSAHLHIILHYCWLAFIQMYFSFYKETVFRCIDI